MKVIRLSRGGNPIISFPNCDGSSVWGCPSAHRVDAIYERGYFKLGAIFQPVLETEAMNAQYRDAKMVAGIEVGDVIEMAVVPDRHKVTDVTVEVDLPMGRGSFAPAVGFTFDVIARHYLQGVTAPCTVASEEVLFTNVNGAVRGWDHTEFVHVTKTEERVVIALVVKTLPATSDFTLQDMENYVAVVATCQDFDVQRQM